MSLLVVYIYFILIPQDCHQNIIPFTHNYRVMFLLDDNMLDCMTP